MALCGCHVGMHSTFSDTFDMYNNFPIQFMLPSYSTSVDDIVKCRQRKETYPKFIHTCLTSNLAGSVKGESDKDYNKKLSHTRRELIKELDIGSCIECSCVVHVGWREDTHKGLLTVIDTITESLSKPSTVSSRFKEYFDVISSRKILLENSAGEKNRLGSSLQELSFIYKSIPDDIRSNLGFCIDTAHLFGAGVYDFGKVLHTQQFFQDFGNTFGLNKLKLFHINDSAADFNTGKDLHKSLSHGFIYDKDGGIFALKELLTITSGLSIPMVSETDTPIDDVLLMRSLSK